MAQAMQGNGFGRTMAFQGRRVSIWISRRPWKAIVRLAKHETLAENLQLVGAYFPIPRRTGSSQSRHEMLEVSRVGEDRGLAADDLEARPLDNRRHLVGPQPIANFTAPQSELARKFGVAHQQIFQRRLEVAVIAEFNPMKAPVLEQKQARAIGCTWQQVLPAMPADVRVGSRQVTQHEPIDERLSLSAKEILQHRSSSVAQNSGN
ncbi:MAG: hypothetical protein ABI614_26200, partial [Planctomycetota bacterium]